MAERRGTKRTFISISTSSSEDEEEDGQSEEQSVSQSSESESEDYDGNDDDEDYDEAEESSASISCDDDDDDDDETGSEWSDDKGDESDDQDKESPNLDNDESLCTRVIRFLREKSDLQELNLKEYKSYLRQHGLRITGTKAECIQRIMEHWRIKDGNAEALYPRSSFSINCTGDVCKGDVVLFTQKVYKKFDKVTRTGNFLGKRTIAGRVVKESYGAAKQQHTFTIEVFWGKGVKKLPPLFPLLVKGRNLYKLKTFRQHWKNETERLKVLAEKHKRGAAARLVRAMKKTKKVFFSKDGGLKRQKHFHHPGPSRRGKKAEPEKGKHRDGCGKAPMEYVKPNNRRHKAPPVGGANLKRNSKARAPKIKKQNLARAPKIKKQNLTHSNKNGGPTIQSYTSPPGNLRQSQMQFQHHQWSAPPHFPPYEAGSSSSAMRYPHFRPYPDDMLVSQRYIGSFVMTAPRHQGLNRGSYTHHAYSHPGHVFEPRYLNTSPQLMNIYGLSRPFSMGKETFGQRRKGF